MRRVVASACELPWPERDGTSSRVGSGSRKWERYAGASSSARAPTPLWVADMDFSAPPAVVDAVLAVASSGHYGYADASAVLTERALERLERRHGCGDSGAEAIRWLPGLNPGLNHAVRAARRMVGEDVSVAVCTPIYPPFLYASRNNEQGRVEVPMLRRRRDDVGPNVESYDVDWDALESALAREEVKILLWCNPHNPVGRVWTREEMVRVARLCVRYDAILCSDEVWRDLILDEDATPFCGAAAVMDEVDGLRERLIVMTSPSKTYNVAGCDVALAWIPDKTLRLHFARAGSDKAEITPFGYAACLAAYSDDSCEEWRQRLLKYLRANRDHIVDVLSADPNARDLLTWTVPAASYLTWVNCERLVDRIERSPFDHFLEHGVVLSEGAPFSAPRSVRINFATRREILDRGLVSIDLALKSARA